MKVKLVISSVTWVTYLSTVVLVLVHLVYYYFVYMFCNHMMFTSDDFVFLRQVLRTASGDKKDVPTTDPTDWPRERRKSTRGALDKNSNIPDSEESTELGELQGRVAVNKTKHVESPGDELVAKETDIDHISRISHSTEVTPLTSVAVIASAVVKTDSHKMHSEKTNKAEVRALVRRTRSFTRTNSTSSPVKIPSPRKQSLVATKAASPRKQTQSPLRTGSQRKQSLLATKTISPGKQSLSPTRTLSPRKQLLLATKTVSPRRQTSLPTKGAGGSPMKTCQVQEKLDHWLVKSCDNNTTSDHSSTQSSIQVVSENCVDQVKDVLSELNNKTDKGVSEKVVSTESVEDTETDLYSLSEDVDVSERDSSQTSVPVSPGRVPVVQLHKLSEREIQSFSPKKKPFNPSGHCAPVAVRQSWIVDRSRDSDDSDSELSALSEDLFAQSQNSVAVETGLKFGKASEKVSDVLVTAVNVDSGQSGKQVTNDNDSIVESSSEMDHLINGNSDIYVSNVVETSAANGCNLGSRSRQRRPPGWLKDMECSPVSPRSRERANQRTTQQSPLVKKTATIKSIDFSQGGQANQYKKASLNFAEYTKSAGNEEFGHPVELDNIPVETSVRLDAREDAGTEGHDNATVDGVEGKSAATTNEDTPQSAPSGVDSGKRNSSKQAKKTGATLKKRTKMRAKVLNTIFSQQCNLDVESSDDDIPLSVLGEAIGGAPLGKESVDNLPLSQVIEMSHKEKCVSGAALPVDDCELLLIQNLTPTFAATVDDVRAVSMETGSSGVADEHLTEVKDMETAIPLDGAAKTVKPSRGKGRGKQSAVERLGSQLGISMTSPVRKCLRSNKSTKLFKPRSTSDSFRRKRKRNISRKRKRSSGNQHHKSSSDETESEAAVCHQDSEAVSECLPLEDSTIEGLIVTTDVEETLDEGAKSCDIVDSEGETGGELETAGEGETGTPIKHKQSVDSKEPDIDRKTSFAMSRASLILHRARLMMLGNKQSPGNSETVAMAMEGDNAKPELPRCVGILKPARLGDCGTVDRGSQSPPSQFRPVQLPCVYSPAASPSAGILKKQRLSSDTPKESPSPKSPSKKVNEQRMYVCVK